MKNNMHHHNFIKKGTLTVFVGSMSNNIKKIEKVKKRLYEKLSWVTRQWLWDQIRYLEQFWKNQGTPGGPLGTLYNRSRAPWGPVHVKNVKILKTIFGPQGPQEVKNVKISEIGRYP